MKTLLINRQRLRAFTLLEVMIALVIVSFSLLSIATAVNARLNNSTTMRERMYASWIAQNKIVELRLTNTVPEVGSTSGDIEFGNAIWDWRTEVSETGIENLYRVDVEISWPGSDERIWGVTGFLGEPVAPGASNSAYRPLVSGAGQNGSSGATE
jgi:general secretion pathway protein I